MDDFQPIITNLGFSFIQGKLISNYLNNQSDCLKFIYCHVAVHGKLDPRRVFFVKMVAKSRIDVLL